MALKATNSHAQRTKYFNSGSGKSGRAYTPNMPKASGLNYRDNLAYQLGYQIGNRIDDYNDRGMVNKYNALKDQIDAEYGFSSKPYLDKDALTKQYLGDVGQQENDTTTVRDANPNLAGAPQITPPSVEDENKRFVRDKQVSDYSTYGANPKQTRSKEEKLFNDAQQYKNADLRNMSWEQISKMIDQKVDAVGGPSDRRAWIKQMLKDDFQPMYNQQFLTDQQMWEMQTAGMNSKDYYKALVPRATQLLGVGQNALAEQSLKKYYAILDAEKAARDALANYKAKKDIDLDYALKYAALKPSKASGGGTETSYDIFGNPISNRKNAVKKTTAQLLKENLLARQKELKSSLSTLKTKDGYRDEEKAQEFLWELDKVNDGLLKFNDYMNIVSDKNWLETPYDENIYGKNNGFGKWERIMEQANAIKRLGYPKHVFDKYMEQFGDDQDILRGLNDVWNEEYSATQIPKPLLKKIENDPEDEE